MKNNLPAGFGYLEDPRIICALAYYTNENFVGRPIAGYNQPICIATDRLLAGLIRVQDDLDALDCGYVLKIFDAYRPQTAVNDFEAWSYDENDFKTKDVYYPKLSKRELFAQGYILAKSSHSRGSAVDLTIVKVEPDTNTHTELDMGTIFDFFGDESHTDYPDISVDARANRQMLKLLMEKHGFKNYPKEWWHYNVVHEQFPDTYFDFPIE
jgi:D-alanyl-D-alanine dipeptidase